jgi:endonuclease/exonuclease/phosphatase family metal-dependent hydrolase
LGSGIRAAAGQPLALHGKEGLVIVGTWNLESLFRPGRDAGPADDQAYDAKLTELARVIGEIDPDILAVQEVGDPEALEDLRQRLDSDWFAQSSGSGIAPHRGA